MMKTNTDDSLVFHRNNVECIASLTLWEIMRRAINVNRDGGVFVKEIRLRADFATDSLSAFGQTLSVRWQSQAACQKKVEPVAFKLAIASLVQEFKMRIG